MRERTARKTVVRMAKLQEEQRRRESEEKEGNPFEWDPVRFRMQIR